MTTRSKPELMQRIHKALVMAVGRKVASDDVQQLYTHAHRYYRNALTDGQSHTDAVSFAIDSIQDAVIFRDMIVKYHC